MKRGIISIVIFLTILSGLFAEEILYQRVHKGFHSIEIAILGKSDDMFYISLSITNGKGTADKYVIFEVDEERIKGLLFSLEKDWEEGSYLESLKTLEKVGSITYLKSDIQITGDYLFNVKYYFYTK